MAKSRGASVEQSCFVVLRCPGILESNVEFCLQPTLVYLRILGLEKLNSPTTLNAHLLNTRVEKLEEKMKRSIEEVKDFPQYFAFSLSRRIAPRHFHLKERNVKVKLNRMLLWSDNRFYTKWK
ncbi:hypothetical protein POM88_035607 [Heracleum sosnowskyi]|uniref:Uncharacterized protein n=1 Tax=Heracleum sosnowskyi TaxID=360622 RepID=A0AAD8HLN2_9APIA|nr:hypothetical protein POM88_035607 [Heracleum sosnowskyi]